VVIAVKASRYNFCIALTEGRRAIYNSATGNYMVLEPDQARLYDQVERVGVIRLTNEQLVALYEGGYLIGDEVDELAAFAHIYAMTREMRSSPHLTIAPTIDCNFGCAYCFERHERGHMPTDIQANLVRFVAEAALPRSATKKLSITWFGGEPLMAMPVIRALTAELRAIPGLDEYTADCITNGYMATPKIVDELRELGVDRLQITIDGARWHHDRRRTLKLRGAPTFDQIITNLQAMIERIGVSVRVNADRSNYRSVPDLLRQLDAAGLLGWVSVNVARVNPFRLEEITTAADLLGAKEFAAYELELLELAASEGWPLFVSNPRPVLTGVCQVDRLNAYVIAPTGEMMKCWAELGNDPHVVGHLREPEGWDHIVPTELTTRDPFDDDECCTCKVLPLCMGSCPMLRQNRRKFGRKECPTFKYNLTELVRRQHGDCDGPLKQVGKLPVIS
jgi:uncharacterized protein